MNCGRLASEVGPISWRGNCEECGLERLVQSVYEQRERRGPMFRRWEARILEGVRRAAQDAPTHPT